MQIFTFLCKFFSRQNQQEKIAKRLYWEIVAISRKPEIYQTFDIEDSLDGRFDSLLLHIFLIIDRLQELSEHKICDHLLNFFTKDMDRSLRETGVGDPSIARKMRKVGEAYMGRMAAYKATITSSKALEQTLYKNVYRTQSGISPEKVTLLTQYTLKYRALLEQFLPQNSIPDPCH